MIPGFKECAPCAAKLGSPTLCDSCNWNRWLITKQDAILANYRGADRSRKAMEKRIEQAAKD